MSEYEMAYLLNEYRMSVSAYGTNAFTTVSAFLVAGYLAAHRLNWTMLTITIFLYSLWLSGITSNMVQEVKVLIGLYKKMSSAAQQGQGLEWHLVAINPVPDWVMTAASPFIWSMMGVIYVVSLMFFFHCRRMNLKAG